MNDDTQGLHDSDETDTPITPIRPGDGHSVIEFLEIHTGMAPRVTLHEEDSAALPTPVINPSSEEKTSVPQGRGSYQVLGEIARGGMGVIMKSHDLDLGRDVAMKVLSKRLAERPEVVQRFVEEAQIGGQLQHPGIVPVYELGLMADERPYFTMKLVKGRTLSNLLAERSSPQENRRRLIDVFESICQTMAYAHSRGVIHRDLKPANVMVGAFGEVQVVDWGLAKVLARGGTADEKRAREAQSQLTILETVRSAEGSGSGSESMVGSVMGTPAYMPPEQASGLVDRLDERSDVFSLGAILCEILTGLPPYTGERSEIIAAAAQAEYDEALARLDASEADPELVKLTKQCLMAAPAARPMNAGIVAERIQQHIVTLEERAHAAQVEAAESRVRAVQERKARRLTLALAASVLVTLLAAGGGYLWVQNERAVAERADAARIAAAERAEMERIAAEERAETERLRAAAERERRLAEQVNEVLAEASIHRGLKAWDEAISATERARALAAGGGANAEVLARIDTSLANVRYSKEEDLRNQELARDTQLLLSEVRGYRDPEWSRDWFNVEEDYASAFEKRGIDLDEGDAETAAETLIARGLGSEIALVLDSWAEVRRRLQNERGALRLLEVAHIVDPDLTRANLREAANNRELDVLLWIAENGFEDQPPATIELLGSALLRLDDRDSAVRVYREGLELYPDDFSLAFTIARLFTPGVWVTGDPAEMQDAVGYYRAALASRPDNIQVRYEFGRLLGKLGNYPEAIRQYAYVLERQPDEGPFLSRLGTSYWRNGEGDRGLPYIERAKAAERVGWWTSWSDFHAARILRDLGDDQVAFERYNLAAANKPQEQLIHSERMQFLMETPGFEEHVVSKLAESLRNFPTNATFLNNLAWYMGTTLREGARDTAQAIAYAERAVAIEPEEPNNWNTLGIIRYYAGDHGGAVRDLEHSMELSGGNVYDWLFLAMAHKRLGDEVEARGWYERACLWMELNPVQEEDGVRFRAEADAVMAERR